MPSNRFVFKNYPHELNNNGRLLIDFVDENDLLCLNPMKWKGRQEELFTYQRNMGSAGNHTSILDLGLATKACTSEVVDFKVTNNESVSVDSDHSTLVLNYYNSRSAPSKTSKIVNIYKKIKNWIAYKEVLERRLAGKFVWFECQSVTTQNSWFIEQLKVVGISVMPKSVIERAKRFRPKSTNTSRKVKQ